MNKQIAMRSLPIGILLVLFLGWAGVPSSFGQVSRGSVQEGLILHSDILNKDVRYTVYLPFDYESSNRLYPVVYLLHGYTDNDMAWLQFGEINMQADKAIAEIRIPPMIIVMPDAGVSWYINNHDTSVRYEDFFFEEFIPFVEMKYRIRREKRYRGVAGLSMGGYGTLVYAMKHHEMFSACAAFSAAVFSGNTMAGFEEKRYERMFAPVFGPGLKGKSRITAHFQENNPFHILENTNTEALKSVRYYIDTGDDDRLTMDNCLLHNKMFDQDIPHEFRVRDGGHSWSYWRSGIIEGLEFIGSSFNK